MKTRIQIFVVAASLAFAGGAFAKTAGCPCSPCKCSPCTCGGGGGSKGGGGGGKHHDDHHGDHHGHHDHGSGSSVDVGVSVDLGTVGQREKEPDPFGSTSVIRHAKKTEKINKVAKRKEVRKTEKVTDPYLDLTQDFAEHVEHLPYDWTDGALIITPAKWWGALQGLTMSADFYHIDLRSISDSVPRDVPVENLGRFIQEGFDYEMVYAFDRNRLLHGDWGTFTTSFGGSYIDQAVLQSLPKDPGPFSLPLDGKTFNGDLFILPGGPFSLPLDFFKPPPQPPPSEPTPQVM